MQGKYEFCWTFKEWCVVAVLFQVVCKHKLDYSQETSSSLIQNPQLEKKLEGWKG